MVQESLLCVAVFAIIYLVCWYITYLLITRYSAFGRNNHSGMNSIFVGISALWWLWIIVGILYGIYYFIKRILFDEEDRQ